MCCVGFMEWTPERAKDGIIMGIYYLRRDGINISAIEVTPKFYEALRQAEGVMEIQDHLLMNTAHGQIKVTHS